MDLRYAFAIVFHNFESCHNSTNKAHLHKIRKSRITYLCQSSVDKLMTSNTAAAAVLNSRSSSYLFYTRPSSIIL